MTANPQMKTEHFGDVAIPFAEGGLYDTYRMKPDLDAIAAMPGVSDVSFFRQIPKAPVQFEEWEIEMPAFYYDLSLIQAVYTADASALQKLLPTSTLEPLRLWPGRALLAFTAFQYRVTDIDPYNEFAISVITRRPGSRTPGPLSIMASQLRRTNWAFVWQLPVTTELACHGGKAGYNYPKYVTELPWEQRDGWVHAEIRNGAETELTMRGKVLPTRRGKRVVNHGMSFKDGEVLDVPVQLNPREAATSYSSSSCELELGTGPIAETLRTLDLGRLVMYDYVPSAQLSLPAGQRIA